MLVGVSHAVNQAWPGILCVNPRRPSLNEGGTQEGQERHVKKEEVALLFAPRQARSGTRTGRAVWSSPVQYAVGARGEPARRTPFGLPRRDDM